MNIINSNQYKDVIETHRLKLGYFYFFKDLVIVEISEGSHLDLKSSQDFFKIANIFYKEKFFGFISNRINKFSVSPLEFANYSKELNNITSFCAITYNNSLDEMNVQIEKRFSQKPFQVVTNINDAFLWTMKIVANKNNTISA